MSVKKVWNQKKSQEIDSCSIKARLKYIPIMLSLSLVFCLERCLKKVDDKCNVQPMNKYIRIHYPSNVFIQPVFTFFFKVYHLCTIRRKYWLHVSCLPFITLKIQQNIDIHSHMTRINTTDNDTEGNVNRNLLPF